MKAFVSLFALLAVAVAVTLFLKQRARGRSPERDAAKARLRQARAELQSAQLARESDLNEASRELNAAQREREKGIRGAQKRLIALHEPKGKALGSYRGVRLYERWIITPHGEGPIAGTQASVDAQVSSRITATRLLAIGVFAFAARKKTGAIYLSIDNPQLASVVECPQDHNAKARQFAVKIMNAAREAEQFAVSLPGRIEAAEQQVAAAVANIARLNTAEGNMGRVEADKSLLPRIEAARREVAAAEADKARLEMAQVHPSPGVADELLLEPVPQDTITVNQATKKPVNLKK